MSIRKRSDVLQRAWAAMQEMRTSKDDQSKLELQVTRNWSYCLKRIKEKIKELWQDCTSWEGEILGLSRQHVRGLLPYHPGFEEPIWPETEAIREGLLRLHSFGLLTQYSEPGEFRVNEDKEGHVATRKRPHLFFTMPTINTRLDKAAIRNFLYKLKRNDKIWYHVTYHYPSATIPTSPTRAFPEYSDQLSTNVPGQDHAKFVCEEMMEDLSEWETVSFQYFPGPEYRQRQGTGGLNDFDRPFQACRIVDPLQICVVSREFATSNNNKQDLQALLLGLLSQSGFQSLTQTEPHSQDGRSATNINSAQKGGK